MERGGSDRLVSCFILAEANWVETMAHEISGKASQLLIISVSNGPSDHSVAGGASQLTIGPSAVATYREKGEGRETTCTGRLEEPGDRGA
jgi:hypothetical protein